jgi:murein DD-endopeptidase MepM/ murein hydrolase activator NlpD
LDHGKSRSASLSRAGTEIDLGNEPPLLVDGGTAGVIDRRRVSVRWFSGTVLTGLCGAALMGGAVYAALDREANFAATPERADTSLRGSLTGGERQAAGPRKADKLQPVAETPSARQIVRIPTTIRLGEREAMRMKPYVRIMANLSLSASDLSANIPAFDARKVLANATPGNTPATDDTPAAEPDPEVTFVTRDLVAALPKIKVAALLPMEDVIKTVRDAANAAGGTYTLSSAPSGVKFNYAPTDANVDPYEGFNGPRIVPENITLLPKTATQTTGGNAWNERTVTVKKGDSAASILRDLGATPDEIKSIVSALGPRGRDGGLKEGQKLRVLLSPLGAGRLQPIRVIVATDASAEAVIALSDTGKYVAVDVQSADTQVADNEEEEDNGSGIRLYQSIYETALRNQVPRAVIDELVRIYSYDVDFQRKVQPGDSFELLYSGGEDETPGETKGDVMFASLTLGGESKRFYRFQTSDDGSVDYYDETGKSAKKFLVRKPVNEGIMRSGYGWRRHPILGFAKMHTGVDWAAPRGTPIYASGNGVVEKAGWEGGYGKYVRLKHNNGYETAYGHMSALARNIQPGTRVRQGQVIGYVGSTGLSTGPHVHYEIMVNNRFVDPMRIKLPRGRVLEGPALGSFDRERERFDAAMNRQPPRVAESATTTAPSRR